MTPSVLGQQMRAAGRHWQRQRPAAGRLHGVDFLDAREGWAVGAGGLILHTRDAGRSWQRQGLGVTRRALRGVAFVDALTGWCVGDRGTILRTDDGGLTWLAQSAPVDLALNDVTVADPSSGWIAGGEEYDSAILQTRDAGGTWIKQDWTRLSEYGGLYGITCFGGGIVWAVGEGWFGESYFGWPASVVSSNGGEAWSEEDWFRGSGPLADVHFESALVGWAVGAHGMVFHTRSGGDDVDSWVRQRSGVRRDLRGVSFVTVRRP